MKKIEKVFAKKGKEILNVYFTAGYPNLEDTVRTILTLEQAGVDLIEVGMPYSDPLADGPTIQQSSQQALANGMTLALLFEQLASVRHQSDVPLILMGYFNQVMQFGVENFLQRCQMAGIDALILPDLPIDVYETEYQSLFQQYDQAIIFLITPQTSEARIRKIDELSRGFIYMVSNSSITGAKAGISQQQLAYFNRINSMQLKNPRLIGFGISNHRTFTTACQYASGAIIGSAFINTLAKADNIEKAIFEFVNMVRGKALV